MRSPPAEAAFHKRSISCQIFCKAERPTPKRAHSAAATAASARERSHYGHSNSYRTHNNGYISRFDPVRPSRQMASCGTSTSTCKQRPNGRSKSATTTTAGAILFMDFNGAVVSYRAVRCGTVRFTEPDRNVFIVKTEPHHKAGFLVNLVLNRRTPPPHIALHDSQKCSTPHHTTPHHTVRSDCRQTVPRWGSAPRKKNLGIVLFLPYLPLTEYRLNRILYRVCLCCCVLVFFFF